MAKLDEVASAEVPYTAPVSKKQDHGGEPGSNFTITGVLEKPKKSDDGATGRDSDTDIIVACLDPFNMAIFGS